MFPIRQRAYPALAVVLLTAWALADRPRGGLAQTEAARWVDGRVCGPFVVRAEFPLSGLHGLLRELSQLQNDLQQSLSIPPAREPIEVYLFRDKRSYTRFLQQHLPDVPYRRALYIKKRGPGKVLACWSRELATDLRHECTHALLHAVLPMVPLWLDEGLAEFFEVPREKRAFDNPYLRGLQWNVKLGMVPRLESLEKKGDLSEMGRAEYRDSWAWVHFMLLGPKPARDELAGYLADIRASTPPGLLSRRLQQRLPATRRYFAAHFKSWKR